jgi:hypothetical protein
MTALARSAKNVGMTDEAWQRHNPWSVNTRFAAITAGILAIWSRTSIKNAVGIGTVADWNCNLSIGAQN